MKILQVVAFFPPRRPGGVGRVASHLHEAYSSAGHDSYVLTGGPVDSRADVRSIAETRAGFLAALPRYAELASSFDIVHCHQGETLPLLAALKLRRAKAPIVVTFHTSHRGMASAYRPYRIEERTIRTGMRGALYRHVVGPGHVLWDRVARGLASAPVFVSEGVRKAHEGGVPSERSLVIPNGLPDASPSAHPTRARTEILFVGLSPHVKRAFALPAVLDRVRREIPQARLRIVGLLLAELPALRADFEHRGLLEAVEWVGPVMENDLTSFYDASQVLLLPSAFEGLPLTLLEGMRSPACCVATKVGGVPEVLEDGRTGRVVATDDVEAMARACIELIRDPGLRARMANAARREVQRRFRLEEQARGYLELFGKLTETPKNGPRSRSPTQPSAA